MCQTAALVRRQLTAGPWHDQSASSPSASSPLDRDMTSPPAHRWTVTWPVRQLTAGPWHDQSASSPSTSSPLDRDMTSPPAHRPPAHRWTVTHWHDHSVILCLALICVSCCLMEVANFVDLCTLSLLYGDLSLFLVCCLLIVFVGSWRFLSVVIGSC